MSSLSHHYHHETYHHDTDVELSYLESFSFLFKSLWRYSSSEMDQLGSTKLSINERTISKKGIDEGFERYRVNIVDTLLFYKGRPFRWLFTSEQSHEVLKKKDDKLDTFQIVKILKEKCKKLCVHKELLLGLRMKIANIWHLVTHSLTHSYSLTLTYLLTHCCRSQTVP